MTGFVFKKKFLPCDYRVPTITWNKSQITKKVP